MPSPSVGCCWFILNKLLMQKVKGSQSKTAFAIVRWLFNRAIDPVNRSKTIPTTAAHKLAARDRENNSDYERRMALHMAQGLPMMAPSCHPLSQRQTHKGKGRAPPERSTFRESGAQMRGSWATSAGQHRLRRMPSFASSYRGRSDNRHPTSAPLPLPPARWLLRPPQPITALPRAPLPPPPPPPQPPPSPPWLPLPLPEPLALHKHCCPLARINRLYLG